MSAIAMPRKKSKVEATYHLTPTEWNELQDARTQRLHWHAAFESENPDPVPGYRSALTRARNVSDLIIGTVVGTVAGGGLVFLLMRHFS